MTRALSWHRHHSCSRLFSTGALDEGLACTVAWYLEHRDDTVQNDLMW